MFILRRKYHSLAAWQVLCKTYTTYAVLNTVNWIFFKTASSGGLFAVPKTWVFRITSIFYLPVMVYSSTEVPGLKTHIYLIPGRALFNQEKSKLMQTKGQLSERFWSCFFVCTTFDSFLNDFLVQGQTPLEIVLLHYGGSEFHLRDSSSRALPSSSHSRKHSLSTV